MDLRVDLVTLGVADVDAATAFYADRLGVEPALRVPGQVTFLRAGGGRLLALYGAAALAADAGRAVPFTLAHNVGSEAEVDGVVGAMVAAGATVLAPATRAEWGGYHAHVADPDGFVWEIAHNPAYRVDDDGTVHIG